MAGIKYSNEQIEELLNNKYVKDCTSKYITFTDEFKTEVLALDNKGIYHREIFKSFGFPEYIVKSNVVKRSLGNWRHKFKNKGLYGLIDTKKGRKKNENIDFTKMLPEEKIKYLETENAFLKEMYKLKHGKYP